jgi:ankyrin repeat protein
MCLVGASAEDFQFEMKSWLVGHVRIYMQRPVKFIVLYRLYLSQVEHGLTALGVAACTGRTDIVTLLVKAGADVNHLTKVV